MHHVAVECNKTCILCILYEFNDYEIVIQFLFFTICPHIPSMVFFGYPHIRLKFQKLTE